ncbi:MAG: hypothetical protein AAGA77_09805 [Bacteroidota bacterium]
MSATGDKRLKYFENSNTDPSPEIITSIREIDIAGELVNPGTTINYPGDLNTANLIANGYFFYSEDPSLGNQGYFRVHHTSNDPRANSNVIKYIPTSRYKQYYRKLYTPKFLLNKTDPISGVAIAVPIGCYTFQRGKSLHNFRRKDGLFLNFPNPWSQQTDWYGDAAFESDLSSVNVPNNSYVNQKKILGVLTCNGGTLMSFNLYQAILSNILFSLQSVYGAAVPNWSIDGLGGDIKSTTTEIECEVIINQANFAPAISTNLLNLLDANKFLLSNISLKVLQEDPTMGLPVPAPFGSVVRVLNVNEFVFTKFSFSVTSFTKANLP